MITDCYKTYDEFGCGRVVSPVETIKKCFSVLSEQEEPILTGIQFKNSQMLSDILFPSFEVKGSPYFTLRSKVGYVSGKGPTPSLAIASGLMEMVERFSYGKFLANNITMVGSSNDIGENQFIVEDLLTVTPNDHYFEDITTKQWNDCKLQWYESQKVDIIGSDIGISNVKLPLVLIGRFEGTNGIASGNVMEEAIKHALCEVVERDCETRIIWWDKKQHNLPLISKESLASNDLLQVIIDDSLKTVVVDCSSIHNIPTICCIRQLRNKKWVTTLGTSTSKHDAMVRAFTESIQVSNNPWHQKDNIGILDSLVSNNVIGFDDVMDISDSNIKTEIISILKILESKGCKTYITDVTDKEGINIPTVFVFVTKLLMHQSYTSFISKDQKDVSMFFSERAKKSLKEGFLAV